jgi:hypothetical protein
MGKVLEATHRAGALQASYIIRDFNDLAYWGQPSSVFERTKCSQL